MPKIYLPEKKEYKRHTHGTKKNNLNHSVVYNTSTWRKLRIEKLKINPLCERCLKKGIIKSGIEVHHKIPISQGKTIIEKERLGFNIDNLETLCKECHKEEHSQYLIEKSL